MSRTCPRICNTTPASTPCGKAVWQPCGAIFDATLVQASKRRIPASGRSTQRARRATSRSRADPIRSLPDVGGPRRHDADLGVVHLISRLEFKWLLQRVVDLGGWVHAR